MVPTVGDYWVEVEKEQLIFSAAHFITFGDNICESLHGHNYRVRCRVQGKLNEHAYVLDFIALRDALHDVTRELDHHVLLPLHHPAISVVAESDEVWVRFENRRWLFPRNDCVLLPVVNTTAEALAGYVHQRLEPLWSKHRESLTLVEIGIDENEGQWGSVQVRYAL